jgi:hypothetical protein
MGKRSDSEVRDDVISYMHAFNFLDCNYSPLLRHTMYIVL